MDHEPAPFDPSRLQTGDRAAYLLWRPGMSRQRSCKVSTVERFTPTQIVLADGSRFYRNGRLNGRMVGGDLSRLVDPDGPEMREAMARAVIGRARPGVAALAEQQPRTVQECRAWVAQLAALAADTERRMAVTERRMAVTERRMAVLTASAAGRA